MTAIILATIVIVAVVASIIGYNKGEDHVLERLTEHKIQKAFIRDFPEDLMRTEILKVLEQHAVREGLIEKTEEDGIKYIAITFYTWK